jgi:hypothetical protein
LLTADTLFGVSRDEMVLIVRTNLRQLGVFFAIITALLFVLSVLSINLGVVIRHKLRARELRRFKHFEHENETSPTVRDHQCVILLHRRHGWFFLCSRICWLHPSSEVGFRPPLKAVMRTPNLIVRKTFV